MKEHKNLKLPKYSIVIPEGAYPAHVSEIQSKAVTVEGKPKIVYNLIFKIAPEVAKKKIEKVIRREETPDEVEHTGEKISAKLMAGKTYRTLGGVWLNLEPKEPWMNRGYIQFFTSLGVEFTTEKIKGEDHIIVGEVEEIDVLGKACTVVLVEDFFENKEGVEIRTLKVKEVFPDENLVPIPPDKMLEMNDDDDDDLPF